MALAILDLLAFERRGVRFHVDTGTNSYYKLKIGRNVQRKSGIDWVDEVYFSSPVQRNAAGESLLSSSTEISIPNASFDKDSSYVQLFSFKTADGRSPAFSEVVKVPPGLALGGGAATDYVPPLSLSPAIATAARTNGSSSSRITTTATKGARMNSMSLTTDPFRAPREIPCRSPADGLARQASLEDLLATIVKAAAPVVLSLLSGAGQTGAAQGAAPIIGEGTNGAAPGQAGILALLLKTLLGSMPGMGSLAAGQTLSLSASATASNRFIPARNRDGYTHAYGDLSRPFIFGIDDALIGSLLGPFIQVLPQLMNAANEKRLQLKQADNKLITDLLSDVNRRMMLQQVLQAQREPPPPGQAAANPTDLTQLVQLLQQLPAGATQPGAGAVVPAATAAPAVAAPPLAGATSTSRSLSAATSETPALSRTAVISFVTGEPVSWKGTPTVVFAKSQPVRLKVQLAVTGSVPLTALPKALLTISFKDVNSPSQQSICFRKTFRQKDVLPGTSLALSFSPEELSRVPANKPLAVFAEMRWLNSKTGNEYKALGSSEVVLTNKYLLEEQGSAQSVENELVDMTRFRPFWNKVWESPVLDAAIGNGNGDRKSRWELNVTGKYSVLLSAEHKTNGLMETKILRGPEDEDSVAKRTEGRLKAGIELSIAELNKLLPLWDTPALDADRLEALETDTLAKSNGGELIYNFKLKGRAGERGMIWVVPTFRLFDFTLAAVASTDDTGQVTALTEEKVRFPLPVSARVIGLKSRA